MCCFCSFDDSILLVYDAYYAHTLQIIVCHMGLMLCPLLVYGALMTTEILEQ